MTRKPKDIEAVLIEAIRRKLRGGMSMNELAQETGVNVAAFSRLLSGERSLTLPSAVKVARVLRLELREMED